MTTSKTMQANRNCCSKWHTLGLLESKHLSKANTFFSLYRDSTTAPVRDMETHDVLPASRSRCANGRIRITTVTCSCMSTVVVPVVVAAPAPAPAPAPPPAASVALAVALACLRALLEDLIVTYNNSLALLPLQRATITQATCKMVDVDVGLEKGRTAFLTLHVHLFKVSIILLFHSFGCCCCLGMDVVGDALHLTAQCAHLLCKWCRCTQRKAKRIKIHGKGLVFISQ